MKNKKLLSILGIAALLVAGNFAKQEVEVVDAANADNSQEKWSAIGTINGTSWNKDFALAYDATDDRYELEIALKANEEFKIRLNNAWTTSIGYGGNTGAGISTYLSNSGGNFKVKTTGNYVLWVKDDNVRNYGDKSYGFGIEKAAEVKYCTVTHYLEDGSEYKTEKVLENSTYVTCFAEKEGYALEGWYTDKALTNKIEIGAKITTDLTLYPKYVEAEDYVVYFDDNGNWAETCNVYMFSKYGNTSASWPGTAIEIDSKGRKYVEVDASKSFDSIIFNNETEQTEDLNLTGALNGDTYKLTEKNTEGKYKADILRTSVYNLFNEYYNEGSYTKVSELKVNEIAEQEVAKYFHASADVKWRKTVYTTEGLSMTTSKDGVTYTTEASVYTNAGEGKVQHTGVGGNYTVNKGSVEEWFYTLHDFVNASTTGWTYENGVYTHALVSTDSELKEDELTKMAREFVAPMWLAPNADNWAYARFNKLTVQVVDGKLVMSLYVESDNVDITDNADGLFSQVTIG